MALVVKDRVQETSTTTGTGTLTLSGAVSGFQSFATIGNGNTTYYSITDGTDWEVGIGTYTSSGTTLSRNTVLESSNSGNLVNFGAGSKFVFCTYPSDQAVYKDASNQISGYAIENTTIGATTASTGKFTTLEVVNAGANAGLTLLRNTDSSTNSTRLFMDGSSGVTAIYNSANSIFFNTSATIGTTSGNNQFRVAPTSSAVNYVQVTGGATTAAPTISAQGSDGNIFMQFNSKGTSGFNFYSGGGSFRQLRIDGANSSVNFLGIAGSVANQVPILNVAAASSDTNVSLAIQPKGTGAIDLAAGSSGVNISNGGTVTAVTRTAGGSGYTTAITGTVSAPTTAGGVQATVNVGTGAITVAIAGGGTGYTVGDTLTVVGGTFFTNAQTLTVSTVSAGVITAVAIASYGNYSVLPTNPVSVTGGTGSGATFNLSNWSMTTVSVNNAGSGYIEQPTVTFSGGGGSGAAAYATVGSATTVKTLGNTLSFYTPSGEGFRVQDAGTTSSAYWTAFGTSTTPVLRAISGVSGSVGTASAVPLQFITNTSTEQCRIAHTASAVNYVQVTGGATGVSPTISTQGSDGNAGLVVQSKGTSPLFLVTTGSTDIRIQPNNLRSLSIQSVGSAVNYGVWTNSAAGFAPALSVAGTDTNIDLALTPKGTGLVRFGTYVAGALTATGYINIKAADGTTYKVLVST